MPLLLSLESLPFACPDVLKYLQTALGRTGKVAFVTAGPVTSGPMPRPTPAPGDPYHELHVVLQRIVGVRLAIQRNPGADVICVLDGWVPPMAFPHPLLHELCLSLERTTLKPLGIHGHEILYLRSCPHESFEKALENSSDLETGAGGSTLTFGDLLGMRERIDAIARGEVSIGPFPVVHCHVVPLPSFCQDNPVASLQVSRKALAALFLTCQKWTTGGYLQLA